VITLKVEELEQRIDLLNLIAQDYKVKSIGSNNYRIDPCPICKRKGHFTVYGNTNSYSSFNTCCKGGSVYKYLMH
jgi:replicative DNA helicase